MIYFPQDRGYRLNPVADTGKQAEFFCFHKPFGFRPVSCRERYRKGTYFFMLFHTAFFLVGAVHAYFFGKGNIIVAVAA